MPFARPTLSTLKAQAAADISSLIQGADALLRRSNLGVLGKVQAALANGLYGYGDWVARMAVPGTSEGEYLQMWGALRGVFMKPAAQATGVVVFAGLNGAVVPENTPIVRSDGVAYIAQGDATVSGGSVSVTALAVAAAAAGNCESGTSFTLGAARPNVNSNGTASGAFTGGADVEDPDAFKARVLQVYAAPPQGGAASDYVEWAEAVAGVTNAWAVPNGSGTGTVVVYFMMYLSEAAYGGFPQGSNGVAAGETRDVAATGDQLAVADAIFPLQPVAALVYACAPGANTVNFTLSQISGVSTAVKNAIKAAIADVFQRDGSPGGVTFPDGSAGGLVDLSAIEAAIAAVPGAAGFVITTITCNHGTITPGSNGNIAAATGYLSTLGTTTFS